MRAITGLLALTLLWLQYQLWFGPDGMRKLWDVSTQLAEQAGENRAMAERNALLAREVVDLRSGTGAIEARARSDLGMIREGEVFYQIVSPAARDTP